MCGIAGSYNFQRFSINDLKKMCSIVHHRGPDNTGVYFDEENKIALGSVRLSILDTSLNGNQPLSSYAGRYVIVYNGEIYNFSLLKNKINQDYRSLDLNFKWKTETDTEVLINGIELYGLESMINLCEGMFAFALWDKKKKKLYLARDRVGEKPLYYGWLDGTFYFMSELKSLKFKKNFGPNISKKSINFFLKYGFISCPNSIFENFYKLYPGSILEIDQNNHKIKKYYDISKNNDLIKNNRSKINIQECTEELDNLLNKKVKNILVADVPVGTFLSSGIDSSLIAAIAQKNSKKKLETFTLFTADTTYDESIEAKKLAKHIGTNYNDIELTKDLAIDYVEKMHNVFCEPLGDSSQIPTYVISKFARKKVKVCLSGDGADEFFGGYNRYYFYKKYFNLLKKIPKTLIEFFVNRNLNINLISSFEWKMNEKLKKIKSISNAKDIYEYYDLLLSSSFIEKKYTKGNLPFINYKNLLNNEILDQEGFEDLMLLDQLIYLPEDILVKCDRASMANSMELRCPYLNHELILFSKTIPEYLKINTKTKEILRLVHAKYYPKNLQFLKKGFSINLNKLILHDLKDWSEELLSKENIKKHEYLDDFEIQNIWKNYKNNSGDISDFFMWNILVMQNWLLNHIKT